MCACISHLYPFSVDGHLDCFHILAIINTAMNTETQVSFLISVFFHIYIHTYIHIYTHVCVCVYICIHIYPPIDTERSRGREIERERF